MSDLTTPGAPPSEQEAGGRVVDEVLAQELVERARSEGVELVGPGGLLSGLTRTVLETALEAELDDHLGYAKHAVEGRDLGNSRNGSRSKTVLTEVGEVEIEVPRDRDGSFEPKIVAKRQRRLAGVDELVISLTAKGLTTGEISAHLADVYGAEVSRDTISRITDAVVEELAGWQSRPLDSVYPVVFIDAIHVKIRDGKVANRPVYTVVGVSANGERDILGLWVGERLGRCEVLASGPERDLEPRHGRRLHRLLRRPQGPPRRDRRRLAASDRADLRAAPDQKQLPLREQGRLVRARPRPAHDLQRGHRAGSTGAAGRARRQVGRQVPGDHQAVAERLGRVRALPRLQPRDPHRHLQHERDREPARPLPPLSPGPRPLP
jgi:putative transposase